MHSNISPLLTFADTVSLNLNSKFLVRSTQNNDGSYTVLFRKDLGSKKFQTATLWFTDDSRDLIGFKLESGLPHTCYDGPKTKTPSTFSKPAINEPGTSTYGR